MSVLYLEATKYVAQPKDGVAVTGWLRDSKGRWTATDVKSRGLGGDGNPVPGLVLLATMNGDGRQFWFIDQRGYEGAAFEHFARERRTSTVCRISLVVPRRRSTR